MQNTLFDFGMEYEEPDLWFLIPDLDYQDDSWVIWSGTDIYLTDLSIELVAHEVIYCN